MQCPTFGDRVNLTGKVGAKTWSMRQKDGTPGVKYNGIYLYKESLSQELQDQLNFQPPDLRSLPGCHRLGVRSGVELGDPWSGWQ